MKCPPTHKMWDAYLAYEARCDHTYEFSCVECGLAPPILLADVNHKMAFNLKGTSLFVGVFFYLFFK